MSRATWVPDRGDVIWINAHTQSSGKPPEMKPFLVLSPKKFNDRTSSVVGLPITSATSHDNNPFAIALHGPRNEISYILAHQPKSLDWRDRGAKIHPLRSAPKDVFADVCDVLNQIVQIDLTN